MLKVKALNILHKNSIEGCYLFSYYLNASSAKSTDRREEVYSVFAASLLASLERQRFYKQPSSTVRSKCSTQSFPPSRTRTYVELSSTCSPHERIPYAILPGDERFVLHTYVHCSLLAPLCVDVDFPTILWVGFE